MKQYFYHLLFVFLLVLIQAAAFRVFERADVWFPQLLLLWAVAFALTHSFNESLWLTVTAGFFAEFFSSLHFGSWLFALTTTALLVYISTRRLTPQELSVPLSLALVGAATLVFPLWFYLFNLILSVFGLAQGVAFVDLYSGRIIWTILSNIIAFYPLAFLVRLLPKNAPATF